MTPDEAKAAAEATKEVAKFGTEVAKGVGSYLARVVGSIPEDTLGLLVGDWLRHKRERNLAHLKANTARILERVERDRLSEPSPSMLIPLLQFAADESRDELQDLWAALLGNLMIDRGTRVRRVYYDMLKQMEPQDAVVLGKAVEIQTIIREVDLKLSGKKEQEKASERAKLVRGLADSINISLEDLQRSVFNLIRIGCLESNAIFKDRVFLSPLGRGLLEACAPLGASK